MPPRRRRGDLQPPSALALLAVLAVLAAALAPADANLAPPRNSRLPPEFYMTTPELVSHWGYPVETHTVQTEDGYLLEIHRIPAGRGGRGGLSKFAGPFARKKTPILFGHGWAASSEVMVLREHDTLAFMLANAGFDVWLINFRGSFYGKRHAFLSTDDEKFWDFSWHENGVLDLPATIDYILGATGESSLLYMGHSMGGTAMLALLSDRPEYNAKVRASFLLAPAAYFYTVRGTFAQIRQTMSPRSVVSVLTENPFTKTPFPHLCMLPDGVTLNSLCLRLYSNAMGPFHKSKNNTYMSVLLRHCPDGTAVNQLAHFVQLIIRGDGFRKFDYGLERNMALYGQAYPPHYNVSNVVAPTFFFHSDNDYQAHPKDMKRLAADVPGTAGVFRTPAKLFNHLDIMYEEESARLVFPRQIEYALKYT